MILSNRLNSVSGLCNGLPSSANDRDERNPALKLGTDAVFLSPSVSCLLLISQLRSTFLLSLQFLPDTFISIDEAILCVCVFVFVDTAQIDRRDRMLAREHKKRGKDSEGDAWEGGRIYGRILRTYIGQGSNVFNREGSLKVRVH